VIMMFIDPEWLGTSRLKCR